MLKTVSLRGAPAASLALGTAVAPLAADTGRQASRVDRPDVPTTLEVDAAFTPYLLLHADRTQSYVCLAAANHRRGTVWATSSDAPWVTPGAVPWLKLEVVGAQFGPHGGKKLAVAKFIQRVNTAGGRPTSADCASPTHIGKRVLVPYSTDYVFYR